MGSQSRLNPFGKDTTVHLPATVRDAYMRELSVGDLVQVHGPLPVGYEIESIAPVVDPSQPPNLMVVTVRTRMRFMAQRDQGNQEFIRVMDRDEVAARRPPQVEEQVEEKSTPALVMVRTPEDVPDNTPDPDLIEDKEPGA